MTEALQESVCLEVMSIGKQRKSIDGQPAVAEAVGAWRQHVPVIAVVKAMHTGLEAG